MKRGSEAALKALAELEQYLKDRDTLDNPSSKKEFDEAYARAVAYDEARERAMYKKES